MVNLPFMTTGGDASIGGSFCLRVVAFGHE
jgi:hypothetical protein